MRSTIVIAVKSSVGNFFSTRGTYTSITRRTRAGKRGGDTAKTCHTDVIESVAEEEVAQRIGNPFAKIPTIGGKAEAANRQAISPIHASTLIRRHLLTSISREPWTWHVSVEISPPGLGPEHEHSVLYTTSRNCGRLLCLRCMVSSGPILNVLGMTNFALPGRALLQIFVTVTCCWYYGSWFLARQGWHTV